MKLFEVKQGLIQKFFKQIEDGVPRERCGGVYQRLRSSLGSPKTSALLEGVKFNEHDNALKAFREFDSSPFATLEVVDAEDKVYFIAAKSGRKHYSCTEVTCEDAEPRPSTAVGVKQAIFELRDELEDGARYRVRIPSLLKEVVYLRDKHGLTERVKSALTRVHTTFTNAGFEASPAGDVTSQTLARYAFKSRELQGNQLEIEVRLEPGVVKRVQPSDVEIERWKREVSLGGEKVEPPQEKLKGPLYTLFMDLVPGTDRVQFGLELKRLDEDELVRELHSAWTKFRPTYEKLKKR